MLLLRNEKYCAVWSYIKLNNTEQMKREKKLYNNKPYYIWPWWLFLTSRHNFIPSPQCALGTTPHLSIRKKAREERDTEGGRKKERKKERKRQEGKCPENDSRRCEEWRGKGKERNKRDNRTLLRHRKRKTCHNIHHNRPKGWVEGGKVNQGVKRGGGVMPS